MRHIPRHCNTDCVHSCYSHRLHRQSMAVPASSGSPPHTQASSGRTLSPFSRLLSARCRLAFAARPGIPGKSELNRHNAGLRGGTHNRSPTHWKRTFSFKLDAVASACSARRRITSASNSGTTASCSASSCSRTCCSCSSMVAVGVLTQAIHDRSDTRRTEVAAHGGVHAALHLCCFPLQLVLFLLGHLLQHRQLCKADNEPRQEGGNTTGHPSIAKSTPSTHTQPHTHTHARTTA
jgi:hypothetical protein